jgi:hypothetical protein
MREKQAANLSPKPLRVIAEQAQQIVGLQALQHRFTVVTHGQHTVVGIHINVRAKRHG